MEEVLFKRIQNLYLNQGGTGIFKETAKWSYFLSILGFVGIGFMVILALFIGLLFFDLKV
jgi:hypothetical protein